MSEVTIWLAVLVVCVGIEIATMGLTTIWFAGGALVAALVSCITDSFLVQLLVFTVVSLVLVYFTRPIALKWMTPHKLRTNYENAVDKTVRITERVDNIAGTGAAVLNGQEWTVRMQQDDVTLEPGELATVAAVEGVKLILIPCDKKE